MYVMWDLHQENLYAMNTQDIRGWAMSKKNQLILLMSLSIFNNLLSKCRSSQVLTIKAGCVLSRGAIRMNNHFLTKLCFLSLSCSDEIQLLWRKKHICAYFSFATCRLNYVIDKSFLAKYFGFPSKCKESFSGRKNCENFELSLDNGLTLY